MQWEKKYEISPEIDPQHQKLFELLEQLHIAMKQGQGRRQVPIILQELVEYTQDHFRYEISILRAANFPEADAHEREHNMLLAEVTERISKSEIGMNNALDLMNFLEDWVKNHILGTDMAYKSYLQTNLRA